MVYYVFKSGTEIFNEIIVLDIVSLKKEYYVFITCFLGGLMLLPNNLAVANLPKQYVLLPFSFENIAFSNFLINILSFNYLCVYICAVKSAELLDLNSINFILYILLIQSFFLIIKLKFCSLIYIVFFDVLIILFLNEMILRTNFFYSETSYLILLLLIFSLITVKMLINKTKQLDL
jgi:hypothetical protein